MNAQRTLPPPPSTSPSHNEALITIIIPVYNVETYIEHALNSLLQQTFSRITILCIDDGSTDNSSKIIKEYMKQDSRIQLLSQENQGVSSARNLALQHTVTPYVMFCDADDYYEHNALELYSHAIEQHHPDLISSGIFIVSTRTNSSQRSHISYLPEEEGLALVSAKDFDINWSQSAKVFKMDIIKRYNITCPTHIKYGEDFYFFYAYLSCCKTIYYIPSLLYYYILRDGSATDIPEDSPNLQITTLAISQVLYQLVLFMVEHGVMKEHIDALIRLMTKILEIYYFPFPVYQIQEAYSLAHNAIEAMMPYFEFATHSAQIDELLALYHNPYIYHLLKKHHKTQRFILKQNKSNLIFQLSYFKCILLSKIPNKNQKKYKDKLMKLTKLRKLELF